MATIVPKLCILCEVCAVVEEMVVQLRWYMLTVVYWLMGGGNCALSIQYRKAQPYGGTPKDEMIVWAGIRIKN